MTTPTKRIEYIDAMRGFTMFLVVIAHTATFGYKYSYYQDYMDACSLNMIFTLFRMPLFFFISGYILYKKDFVWSSSNTLNFLTKKFRIQIISTIIWLTLFGMLFRINIDQWLMHDKLGYWFTTILFLYFVCYTIIKVLCHIFSANSKTENILLILIALIGIAISPRTVFYHLGISDIWEYMDIKQMQYLQYFILGVFCKKYNSTFINVIKNNIYNAAIIISFIAATTTLYLFNLYENQLYFNIIRYLCGHIGILLVFSLFYKYQDSFTRSCIAGKVLQFIGRRTLDIYFIHYFLLPRNLDAIGIFFRNHPNPIIEFTLTLCLALLVVGGAIIISQIIRLSPFLTYWLLGGKHMSACDK